MGHRDIKSQVGVKQLFTKISRNAAATIQGDNVTEFDAASFCIDIGAYTSGDGFDITLQHRDGDGAWVAIPHDQLDTDKVLTDSKLSIREADADSQVYVGYSGSKEQIGAVLTRVDDGIMVFGVMVVKGYPKRFPVNG